MSSRDMLRLLGLDVFLIGLSFPSATVRAQFGIAEVDFSGHATAEARVFPQSPLFSGQNSHTAGFVLEYTVYFEDESGRILNPFLPLRQRG